MHILYNIGYYVSGLLCKHILFDKLTLLYVDLHIHLIVLIFMLYFLYGSIQ